MPDVPELVKALKAGYVWIIILMLLFYITGLAFLVGGEINSTIEHAAAEHGHPEAKAEGQKALASHPQRR